jgi:DNA-directed RNA polymerase specialized sigma24 family protein
LDKKAEIELVNRVMAGDVAAREDIFTNYIEKNLVYLKMLVSMSGGNDFDSDDIVSKYVIRLFSSKSSLRDFEEKGHNLKSWIRKGLIWEYKSWLNQKYKNYNRHISIELLDIFGLQLDGDENHTSFDDFTYLVDNVFVAFIEELNQKERLMMRLIHCSPMDDKEISILLTSINPLVMIRKSRLLPKLRNGDCLSDDEKALLLGMKNITVRTQKFRLKKKFKEFLKNNQFFEEHFNV